MEKTTCLLCGAEDGRGLLRRSKPQHVVCPRCGLVYQNPRPTVQEILAYYQQGYWEDRGNIEVNAAQPLTAASLERGQVIVDWARPLIKPSDLIIEIGCGHGEILAYIRDQFGCQALGIEPSPAQSAAASSRFGLEMINSDLDGAKLPGPPARLLVLSHVLEHFHDPRRALARCREFLTDDGWIFVEVPNILHPHPRKRLSSWLAVEHMYYFSVGTLSHLLSDAGFCIKRTAGHTAVRALAQKTAASAERGSASIPKTNEYRRVMRALAWHEAKYWPRYLALRTGRLLLGRNDSPRPKPTEYE